jgi:carbonic anhydrase/acetyltransferase-like protein (isoleucine patch superfamily)
MGLRPFNDREPAFGPGVYIDKTAVVIGDVALGRDVSVWPMSVIRGDVNSITIGDESNIQDGAVLHVTHRSESNPSGWPLVIGSGVTVGHKAVLHGCRVGDLCLIGVGAIILDGAHIEDFVMVGAGALVPPGKRLQSGYLYVGSPARPSRPLRDDEVAYLTYSKDGYVRLKNQHARS